MWIDLHRVHANVDLEYQDLLTSSGDGKTANRLSHTIPSDATSASESLFSIGFHISIGIPISIGIHIPHRVPNLHEASSYPSESSSPIGFHIYTGIHIPGTIPVPIGSLIH